MDDGNDRAVVAANAFDVLSDPSRVGILQTLADLVQGHDRSSVEFAELRRASGFEDAGRFNYHLAELRDQFVVKRGGGYAPTYAGRRALESVESGVYTADPDPKSGDVDYECPSCGQQLAATYENHQIAVECDEHGKFFGVSVPPYVATDVGVDEILRYAIGEVWQDIDTLATGSCPVCGAGVTPVAFHEDRGVVWTDVGCKRCFYDTDLWVGGLALAHPDVVALYHRNDIDVRRHLPRDHASEWMGTSEVVATDPASVELTVTAGDEAVDVRVDETLAVETT